MMRETFDYKVVVQAVQRRVGPGGSGSRTGPSVSVSGVGGSSTGTGGSSGPRLGGLWSTTCLRFSNCSDIFTQQWFARRGCRVPRQ
jgi:hypothetical protein